MTGYAKSRTWVYERVEGNIRYMCDVGRDLVGREPVEYWESRFLETCDIGLAGTLRCDGGEVIKGGSAG